MILTVLLCAAAFVPRRATINRREGLSPFVSFPAESSLIALQGCSAQARWELLMGGLHTVAAFWHVVTLNLQVQVHDGSTPGWHASCLSVLAHSAWEPARAGSCTRARARAHTPHNYTCALVWFQFVVCSRGMENPAKLSLQWNKAPVSPENFRMQNNHRTSVVKDH